MTFEEISKISALLARDYAKDFFRLLATYQTISASESAARLDLHIKTAQDFLEELYALGLVDRTEVSENKRPYFRYELIKKKLFLEIDFSKLEDTAQRAKSPSQKIREKKDAPALFTPSAKGQKISSVTFFQGKGRERTQRKIGLTERQGRFLFYLPFPTDHAQTTQAIMEKAGLADNSLPEIVDVLNLLKKYGVIEISN